MHDRVDRGCWRRDDGPADGLNGPLHGSPSPRKYAFFFSFFFIFSLICAMNFVNMYHLGKCLGMPKHA
jgi:hypothetical protein